MAFADTMMVGHYSTAALASASFVNNLFNVIVFGLLGFAYGLTPIAGAFFAQKRYGRIGSLMRYATIANVGFALLLTAIMTVVYLNVDRMGQPVELLPLIRPYFLIVMSSLVPLALFNVYAQWSYAINHTRMPMWIILGCNLLNILGNYLLIYGHWGFPELGLVGAGISTLVSRLVMAVLIIGIFLYHKVYRPYSDCFRHESGMGRDFRRILSTSIPVSLQMVFESGSFTVAAVMAGWIDAISLASFQVIVILGTLGFCVYYSIGAAVSVLISNAAGLSDHAEMRRIGFAGYRIMLCLATVSSLIFIFAGPAVMHMFTNDPAVIALSLSLIVPLVLYQYGDATQITFANALRGTSDVMPMVWISFASYMVIGIPATWILGFPCHLGIYGIILSFSVSLFTAAALFLYCFMRTTRLRR
ncbi:MAG: MATE family efflux transporter [Bacteroides sp.]|nr:MATE family efflux transporter [Bacteroides sp.]